MFDGDFWRRPIAPRRPAILSLPLAWLACGVFLALVVGLAGQAAQTSPDLMFNALGFAVFVGPIGAAVALFLCARAERRGVLTRRKLMRLFLLTGLGFAVLVPGLIAVMLIVAGLAGGGLAGGLAAFAVSIFVLLLGVAFGAVIAIPTAFVSALIALGGFASRRLSPSERDATS